MKSNEQLHLKSKDPVVTKADMAVADLTAGGLLVAEQMQTFIRVAIKEAVATSLVTVTTMRNPTLEIPKMTTFGRVMRKATESEALPTAQRSKPGFDKTTITSTEVIAEIHIPRQALEDQIERETFQSSCMAYAGEHIRYDLEDLLVNGDSHSADTWLATVNGMLDSATSNTLAGGSVGLNKAILRDLFTTMPEQFDSQSNLQYWTNRKARSTYRSSIGDRGTSIGDAVILGSLNKEIGYDDILLRQIPLFPSTLGTGNKTNVLLHDPKNAILAFQRQMTLDTEYRISQRVYVMVVTMRLGFGYRHEPMIAKATDVIGA